MPNNRGTFQGNLAGTGSRILEMLTSSKAVTASYAVTASRLATSNVGQNGQPVYFQDGVPVVDTKTQDIVNWVVNNSGSISGATGSSADTNIQVQELVEKSGSWENASNWVGESSSSVSNTITKVNNLKGISFATGATRITASYHPTSSSQVIINIPSNPGHIGAASASHNHTFSQITDGTAISASVKRLEVSASTIKNSYVTTASFNNFTQSVASGFLPITGGTLTGNLETKDVFIDGNLFVSGTTTTINAENLNVKDKLILIASGSDTRNAANGAGIAVSTASAGEGGAARIQYLSSGNKFTSSVAFEAPSFTGSLEGTATNAVSASYSTQAGVSISASYATSASRAVNANNATSSVTASYALVAESVKDASGLTVKSADTASYVEWNNVSGHPTFVSATFQTGAFSTTKTYNPVGSAQTINIPSTTTHISGLNAITASVKQMVAKTASWDGVASTASQAYQDAVKALATASVAQREAESASYYKTQASASAAWAENMAIDAENYADEASGSMEDARFYRSQAATNATLSSTYAVQSSASAQLAAASASAAHTSKTLAAASASAAATYATRAQQSASSAHTSKTLAAASASAASSSAATAANWAVSASASANQIQADTTIAANWAASSSKYATNASASASLMYQAVGSSTQPVYMTTDGPTAATAYSAASVKEAVTASRVAISAVNTNANQPLTFASGTTPSNPAVIQYDANLTYNASTNRLNVTHVSATGLTGSLRGNVVGNVTGTASYADKATTASYALIAEAVKDGAGLVVNTASYALLAEEAKTALTASYNAEAAALRTIITNNSASWATDNDTKVTSAANHYKATNQISGSQGGTNTTYVHAITLDAAGHVTAVSTTNTSSIKAASASYATNADSAKTSTSASYSNYAGNAGQLAGQAASNYALKSYTDGAYLPITGGVITGNLTVQQNLTVAGSASYLHTTDLVVEDKLILVASGSTSQTSSDGAGIAIQTASATTIANAEKAAARFQYRSSDNHFTASVGIVAPSFTGSLLGTASRAVSASRADSAASATTATTASYNKAGADALAWISGNSSSALTKYHPLSGTVGTPLLASKVTVGDVTKKYDIAFSQYGSTSSLGFGVGSGGINRGIYQYANTGSTNSSSTGSGWLLSWDNDMTASFGLGFRISATGFIGPLQGNATTATRATLLANATSGSSTQPVYINAGKPTACSGYVVTAAQTASWDGVASTASQAYQSASAALATASVAQVQAESASNYKTQASASAAAAATSATQAQTYRNSASSSASVAKNWSISASNYAGEASGSMEDARFYSAQAATNATLASTYAIQASASANIISASTVDAQRYATNASASASLLYSSIGSELHPVYMKTTGPVAIQEGVDEFIEDTRASAVAAFTGVSKDTSLYQGKTIRFRLHYAGASNATLNLTLADGTTTGAVPIYFSNTTRLGTQYATNNVIELTYSASVWKVVNPYTNSNTTYPRAVTGSTTPVTASHIPIYTKTLAGTALTEVQDSGVNINDLVASASVAASAVKLVGTSGSTSIPVYINAGVPTVCAGTVVSTADRNTWTTASSRASDLNQGYTVPLRNEVTLLNGYICSLAAGSFTVVPVSSGALTLLIEDDEPDILSGNVYNQPKVLMWGGLVTPGNNSVTFVSDQGSAIVWSENSADIEAGGTYEFNLIQYEDGGTIYGIITKYSES